MNARQLHQYLEVGKDFSNWIKDRIGQFQFVENHDFELVVGLSSPISASSKARQQKTSEYMLTMDMAKELAMLDRSERGKEARLYFIARDKELQKVERGQPLLDLSDPLVVLRKLHETTGDLIVKSEELVAERKNRARLQCENHNLSVEKSVAEQVTEVVRIELKETQSQNRTLRTRLEAPEGEVNISDFARGMQDIIGLSAPRLRALLVRLGIILKALNDLLLSAQCADHSRTPQ